MSTNKSMLLIIVASDGNTRFNGIRSTESPLDCFASCHRYDTNNNKYLSANKTFP